mmetsp:Transcript_35521/g.113404  ORF Transcript_35521/g.113404 Transcript_35521/m.113404 type:complete len:94 (-) Transcript_35521:1040-1321(-)
MRNEDRDVGNTLAMSPVLKAPRLMGMIPEGILPTCLTWKSLDSCGMANIIKMPTRQLTNGPMGPSIFNRLYLCDNFLFTTKYNKKIEPRMKDM